MGLARTAAVGGRGEGLGFTEGSEGAIFLEV